MIRISKHFKKEYNFRYDLFSARVSRSLIGVLGHSVLWINYAG